MPEKSLRIWPGAAYPLGATWDGEGVNFSIFSENATAVELCLFDEPWGREKVRIPVREQTDQVWHLYCPDLRPGQLYGYRVHGRYAPDEGHRFNPQKLLIDPYAKAIDGAVRWSDALFGYRLGDTAADLSFDHGDSARGVPKSVVIDSAFTWGEDRPPRVPWNRTVIYEAHVKGLTLQHPDVPEELRGTYSGLVSDPIIDHLLGLGVTAIELMPIHHFVNEQQLQERKLQNYWGYNSIGFFAPDSRYATGGTGRQVYEFKSMVKGLHRAGIEVILDVVYNHTAEGNHLGPTLSLRGIDNAAYYRLLPAAQRYYLDFTGCGNSLNMLHPRTIQLIMDSLRYWVTEMHVDGFRFDLAPALARELHDVNRLGTFFDIIHQDPEISQVKLIAEPWDLGEGGYQVGNFPIKWAEWNGKYRDTVRSFWRCDEGQVAELASRLSGSSDLYQASNRAPNSSINFVACHDGFTLADLTAYERKHNEANGDENRDGTDHNLSRNWGVEGPTESLDVVAMRERMKRNFLATLFFSQGVPMIAAGDEMGRTQQGNNNAYCQDNPTSWIDWNLGPRRRDLLEYTKRLVDIRRSNPVLRRRSFFGGRPVSASGFKDVTWLRADGKEMTEADWRSAKNHVLGMLMDGRATDETDDRGRPVAGDTLLLLLNGGDRPRHFTLPEIRKPSKATKSDEPGWYELVRTTSQEKRVLTGTGLHLAAHSLLLLRYGVERRGGKGRVERRRR